MEKQQKELKLFKNLYNLLDWIDFGLAGLIIFYYGRKFTELFDFEELLLVAETDVVAIISALVENASVISIVLLSASLVVCLSFICLTIIMRKKGHISAVRAFARVTFAAFWIPLDVAFLLMILTG